MSLEKVKRLDVLKQPEVELIVDLLQNEENLEMKKDINWVVFINHVRNHELLPLTFWKLKKEENRIPFYIYNELKNSYYFNLGHNLILWKEFINLWDIFKQKNLIILPIKGMDLAVRFYPDFRCRHMVDIDILVREGDLNFVKKILIELGYQKDLIGLKEKYWREKQCHIAFKKSSIYLEVHWALDFKRKDRILLPRLWERKKQIEVENRKIDILSSEDALFSFALHNRRMGRIFCLKQVYDIARIINEYPGFDWNYILRESKRAKMEATLYFCLMQAKFFTNANIPLNILKKLNVSWWKRKLIQKLILNSTFSDQFISNMKTDYLKSHFLIYDSLWESIEYILNIPYEQFCKFYNLRAYIQKSNLLYRMRIFLFLFSPFQFLKKYLQI